LTHWWNAIVPELARAYRIVRIDLLGHGKSAKPGGPGYQLPEHARRVGAALDQLGVEQTVGIGHSTGGLVVTGSAPKDEPLIEQHISGKTLVRS
jgi:pimeloyl-ACP methyl ester carboxylesterase